MFWPEKGRKFSGLWDIRFVQYENHVLIKHENPVCVCVKCEVIHPDCGGFHRDEYMEHLT